MGLSVLYGQPGKGKISLGATSFALGLPNGSASGIMSLGFGTSTYNYGTEENKAKIFNFNIQPKVGYWVTNAFSAGIAVLGSTSSSEDEGDSGKEVASLFTIGPFFRYYFPVSKNYLFLEAEAGFGTYKDKWTGTNSYTDKYNVTAYGLGAGLFMPVGTKAGFDISMGYESYKVKYTEGENEKITTGSFGIKAGFLLTLGKE